jgi:hypothetical protein
MSESAAAMSTKVATLSDVLKEGEYETQFGKVVISRSDNGYKIVIYINERELGRNIANQIALSIVGPYIGRREQIV